MKLITPIILILIAGATLFLLAMPMYKDIGELRKETASYNQALGNSKALENERDKLTAKYNSFSREDLSKLEKFLPENVDNIRLILEIEQMAAPYGMALRNVKYNAQDTSTMVPVAGVVQGARKETRKDYGIFDLEFSTSGGYNDFMNFMRDLENNLRIVDVSGVSFSSNTGPLNKQVVGPEVYEYDIKIRTYWLKD